MTRATVLSRMLAAYQAAGVIWGAQFAEEMLPVAHGTSQQLMLGAYIGFVCLLVISGILLWRGHRLGVPLFAVTQVLQVPDFVVGGYLYMLYAPARLTLGLNLDSWELTMRFNVGTGCLFGHSSRYAAFAGINGAPVIATIVARWRASLAVADSAVKDDGVTTAA